jgi:nucleoside-diphosphate-sugar epimerase
VTGASGYIASDLIRVLLSKGLKVNGTVRSKTKASHLFNLPGASESTLTLFEADLMGDASAFTPAITGCRVVFHTACPFVYSGRASTLSEQYFVEPAVKGTESVLSVCAAVGGVERVVMTSSCAAIFKRLVPE